MASPVHTLERVRVCLYWNEQAGEGTSLDELCRMIEKAGHQIGHVIEHGEEIGQACRKPHDCLVAAGGDGTIARAGRALAHGEMPLAIIPMGTANNIATSLGINPDPERAINAWKDQRVVCVDVGVVEDAQGRCLFLEGVGVGLLPAGIAAGRKVVSKTDGSDPDENVTKARKVFLDTLLALEPRRYGLSIEGTSFEDESLLVEILNIPSVGPRIRLSNEANPADGLLSVVVAGSADRELIADHLRGRWDDDRRHAQLKTWRASRVEVRGWHDYHVDDEVREADGGTVEIHIEPGALPVLA
jgi:diacylglycerol kinase family enzyme